MRTKQWTVTKAANGSYYVDQGITDICEISRSNKELENATLIAAAPELYELLSKINEAFYTRSTKKEWLELMEQTKPLLKKARGEQ